MSARFAGLGKNAVIALSLLAAGAFAAWRLGGPLGGDTYVDGRRAYTLDGARLRRAVWDAPAPLAGAVNTPEIEGHPTRSADGRWLAFAVGERGANAELWLAELDGDIARAPRPLAGLNTRFDELAPRFADGALWFASDRPGGAGGFDLWCADFVDGVAGAPRLVAGDVNGPRDELDPAPLADGALVFASNRAARGRACDLFRAEPTPEGWRVEPLRALSSRGDDREPSFAADGGRVVFASDRGGAFALYESVRDGGAWQAPTRVPGLDAGGAARAPELSPDGFRLAFERGGDVFVAASRELFLRRDGRPGWVDLLVLAALLTLALLALLAKRWRTVEVLYKCFLVSVVAHLLLLWWFRGLHPEGEVVAFEQGSPTYEVRLASASLVRAAQRERAGALDLARRARATARPCHPARARRSRLRRSTPRRTRARARRSRTTPRRRLHWRARGRVGRDPRSDGRAAGEPGEAR
ncbi:MAG: PD40 domain-containing protein [Planctomycetes bacterium]|nr:PD40 domain-containing protein [Planctomycetota bacterium]